MHDSDEDEVSVPDTRELRRLDGGRYGDKSFDRREFYRALGWQMPA